MLSEPVSAPEMKHGSTAAESLMRGFFPAGAELFCGVSKPAGQQIAVASVSPFQLPRRARAIFAVDC
jgi:hypothetical protein